MDTSPVVSAIIETLEDAGLTVGDGHRPNGIPEDPGSSGWAPYTIVFLQPGGLVNGSAANPDEEFDGRFALVSVGRLAAEARAGGDAADAAVTVGFTVAGRSIQRVRPIEANGTVNREDTVTPPLFSDTRRYGFYSFPA